MRSTKSLRDLVGPGTYPRDFLSFPRGPEVLPDHRNSLKFALSAFDPCGLPPPPGGDALTPPNWPSSLSTDGWQLVAVVEADGGGRHRVFQGLGLVALYCTISFLVTPCTAIASESRTLPPVPKWGVEIGLGIPTFENEMRLPVAVWELHASGWLSVAPWIALGLGLSGATGVERALNWVGARVMIDARLLSQSKNGLALRAIYGAEYGSWEVLGEPRRSEPDMQVAGLALLATFGSKWGNWSTGPELLFHGNQSWSRVWWSSLQWVVNVGFDLPFCARDD
jgi:hypothetical protein